MSGRFHVAVALLLICLGTSLFAADLPDASQLPSRPQLPDPLVMLSGEKITTPAQWNEMRRPELKQLFQHYMYGYFPAPPDKITAVVEVQDEKYFGGKATKKQVTITYHPQAPKINVLLIVPNHRTRKAPVFVGINFCGNHTVVKDSQIPLPTTWIYKSCPGCEKERATDAGRGGQVDVWNAEQTIDRGYALATFYNGDLDPDQNDFTDGVHPHYFKAGQTKPGPQDWGAIAAWAWGAHRVVDYLHMNPDIDTDRIALVGHSRLGKATLLAGAFDERIDLLIPHQAGCGGTAPSRGKIGEPVHRINTVFPHWFNDEFPKFNDHTDRLPFDQHCLVGLCAPRPVLFSNAVEDTWANPDGQFEMLQAATPVYRLLGVEGLAPNSRPEIGKLIDSKLGYFVRAGKHSMNLEDWQAFWAFADKHFGKPEGK
ncbi:MAG: hypothetical protein JWM11_746 [Planctomycetaceae bacterium]|nr:hypothetical protein [Planctomycetaceae bacterium]